MPLFPKPYADAVQRARVPAGFLIAFAFALFARPTPTSLLWSLPVIALGLGLRSWAAGHLRKNEELATGGPYGWMRNPLYAGSLIVALGFVIAAAQPWLGVLFIAVFVLVYWPVMEQEQEHLRKLFPEYSAYAARVPLLWPRRPIAPSLPPFDWAIYLRNQEYKALAAIAVGLGFLAWRAVSS
jgi:protein-S-isoprenylcysteine O-methyltransferase Ste14